MRQELLITDALMTAASRLSIRGDIPASALAVALVAHPDYSDRQLAQIMRQLSNVLDKENNAE